MQEFVLRGTVRTQSSLGVAEAVHVRDGLVISVGDDSLVEELRHSGVVTVEAPRGGAVLPALIDPHVHLTQYAVGTARGVDCRVPACVQISDVLDALRDRARDTAPGEWVIGYGNLFFDQKLAERRYPTRGELDSVSVDHPIVLHCGGHVSLLNSPALEQAQVERFMRAGMGLWGSPVVQLDEHGQPTGYVAEIDGHLPIPQPSESEIARWLSERYREDYLAHGVVTVGEMLDSDSQLNALERAIKEDDYLGRIALYAMTPAFRDLATSFDWVGEYPGVPGRLWGQGVKLFVDGGYSARNAASMQPYSPDHSPWPGYRGRLNKSRTELMDAFARSARNAIQLAIHTNGTRAQAEVLAALRQFGEQLDVRVEHLGNVLEDPALIDDWKLAGVRPVMQPGFLANFIGDYLPMLFPGQGVRGRMPLRTIIDAAIEPVFSSDITLGGDIGANNPWRNIWAAVARRSYWGLEVERHEAISVEEALLAYTTNAAAAIGRSDELGSLAPGMRADITVTDVDPVNVPIDQLPHITTRWVFRDGVRVFDSESAGAT